MFFTCKHTDPLISPDKLSGINFKKQLSSDVCLADSQLDLNKTKSFFGESEFQKRSYSNMSLAPAQTLSFLSPMFDLIVFLSVCPSVCPSVRLPSVSLVCLSVGLFFCLFICQSICSSLSLSIRLPL